MRKISCPRCKTEGLKVVDAKVGRWRATITLQCIGCLHWYRSSSKTALAMARQHGFLKDFHGA